MDLCDCVEMSGDVSYSQCVILQKSPNFSKKPDPADSLFMMAKNIHNYILYNIIGYTMIIPIIYLNNPSNHITSYPIPCA